MNETTRIFFERLVERLQNRVRALTILSIFGWLTALVAIWARF